MRCTCSSRGVIPCTRVTRELFPRESFLFWTVLVCTGFREIDTSAGCYGTGTEKHGEIDISAGIVWMRMGNKDFHGNDFDETSSGTVWVGPQERYLHRNRNTIYPNCRKFPDDCRPGLESIIRVLPVSYTHLTLPTNREV